MPDSTEPCGGGQALRPGSGQAWGDLRKLRDGWDEVDEAEETRRLRQMTVQESPRHLAALQRALEPQLQQTETLFRAERLAYLEELQRRLNRMGEWTERQNELPA